MSRKKLLSELDLDDLIASATNNTNKPVEVYEDKDDLLQFLSIYKVYPGSEPVNDVILFKLYKFWSQDPLHYNIFSKRLNELFEWKKTHKKFFYLNQSYLNISQLVYRDFLKKSRSPDKSPAKKQHIDNFLNHYGLKPGSIWVSTAALYYLYDKWCYNNGSNNIKIKTFAQVLKIFFRTRRTARTNYYRVSQEIYNHLTREKLDEYNALTKTLYDKNKKKQK